MKKIVEKEGRTFECYLSSEYQGKMCVVSVYEVVRPSWKIFRTSYQTSESFWISDYDTIAQGVEKMVDCLLVREKEEEERRIKWKALSK